MLVSAAVMPRFVRRFLIKLLVVVVPSVISAVNDGVAVPDSVIIFPNPDHAIVAIPSISKSIDASFTAQFAIL